MSGRSPLTGEVEALVRVSAALAARDDGALDRALAAARTRANETAVEEVLLQSCLFLGYPIALNGFVRWRALEEDSGTGGTSSGDRAETPDDPLAWPGELAGWAARGATVCRTVYGGQYPALRENVRKLHPELERWMVVEGYGKVLGRPGLALPVRELCIAAILAVLETPRQLYSHLRGALNAGAAAAEVEAALEIAASFATAEAARSAAEIWREVADRFSAPRR